MLSDTTHAVPIDGIVWSWTALAPHDVQALLPFVMAADPSGMEALRWQRDAMTRLAASVAPHGIVGIRCLAGIILAYFFWRAELMPDGERQLVIDRLRWLELARPHRSLDAALLILLDAARVLGCVELLVQRNAAIERCARQALAARVEAAGFADDPAGWRQRVARHPARRP